MWDILPLKTAYVPVRPYFQLTVNPKTFYDKFQSIKDGEEEFILNSFLRFSRLNATVNEADSMGECR